jgi:hypothetical protein
MWQERLFIIKRDKLSRHPQMYQQHLIRIKLDKDVFSTPFNGKDPTVAEFTIKGTMRNAGSGSFQLEFSGEDPPSND